MKSAEEITESIIERIMPAIDAYCRIYGAQVREEAAKMAGDYRVTIPYSVHCSNGIINGACDFDGVELAAAIRKMELP